MSVSEASNNSTIIVRKRLRIMGNDDDEISEVSTPLLNIVDDELFNAESVVKLSTNCENDKNISLEKGMTASTPKKSSVITEEMALQYGQEMEDIDMSELADTDTDTVIINANPNHSDICEENEKYDIANVTRDLLSQESFTGSIIHRIAETKWTPPTSNSFNESFTSAKSEKSDGEIALFNIVRGTNFGLDLTTSYGKGKNIKIFENGNRDNCIKIPFVDSLTTNELFATRMKHGSRCEIGQSGQYLLIENSKKTHRFEVSLMSPKEVVTAFNNINRSYNYTPMKEKITIFILEVEVDILRQGMANAIEFIRIMAIFKRLRVATYNVLLKKYKENPQKVTSQQFGHILRENYMNVNLQNHPTKYPFKTVFAELYRKLQNNTFSFI